MHIDIDDDILIRVEVSKSNLLAQISRAQALAEGKQDEVCPKYGCTTVFLAGDSNPVVRGCKHTPCHYDPPKRG